MELSDWIAVAAVVVAVGSFVIAAIAAARASDAVNLQRRIDDRQREFRAVGWSASWRTEPSGRGGGPKFQLTNTGLTRACQVTLVLFVRGGHNELHVLGDVDPGSTTEAELRDTAMSEVLGGAVLDLQVPRYRVHWSSPLGQVDTFDGPGPDAMRKL